MVFVTKEETYHLGEMFPSAVKDSEFVWPFEKDFSDIEQAYIEKESDFSGTYVLLKENKMIKVFFHMKTGQIEIKTINTNKIVCLEETIGSGSGFIDKIQIQTTDGKNHDFFCPTLQHTKPQDEVFIRKNIDNYAALLRSIIR